MENNILKHGPYGSQEDTNWSMTLDKYDYIQEILICHGNVIDEIGFNKDATGVECPIQWSGGDASKPRNPTTTIFMKDSECIIRISGKIGIYRQYHSEFSISSLMIYTNLNPNGYGPYGDGKDCEHLTEFTTPLLRSDAIVKIYGRQHAHLGSIGIHETRDIVQHGPYGSHAETNWALALDKCDYIKELLICHGNVVHGIGFKPFNKVANEVNCRIQSFGRDKSDNDHQSKIVMKNNEYMIRISGKFGTYRHYHSELSIASLRIHTNLNPNGYGPYGDGKNCEDLTEFTTPLLRSDAIVKIYGRQHAHLGSIGIHEIEDIVKHRPYGSKLATDWFIDIDKCDYIKEVLISHSLIVDGISFVKVDASGIIHRTEWFGGGGGSPSRIVMKNNEYIIRMSGKFGIFSGGYKSYSADTSITSLFIHTNVRPSGYGPYGASGGCTSLTKFSTPLLTSDAGYTIYGKKHVYLGSIGIYARKPHSQKIEKHGPFGYQRGKQWSIMLEPGESFIELIINTTGALVDGITFVTTKTHRRKVGGDGGSTHEVPLKRGERITNVSGLTGDMSEKYSLAKLKIETNLCTDGHGPFGGEPHTTTNVSEFRSQIPSGALVVGFFGTVDDNDLISSIGLYVKQVQ